MISATFGCCPSVMIACGIWVWCKRLDLRPHLAVDASASNAGRIWRQRKWLDRWSHLVAV
jgi:hypothetical protein